MQELRLVAVHEDGERLVLAGRDGTRFTLPLDARLVAVTRGDGGRLGQLQIELESQLRPREIQARIRAGESAESVAQAAGVSVERVRRFEGPVLAEREHVAAQARGTAVRRSGGDGFSSVVPLLGDVVLERLRARGVDVDDLPWDAWRREDGQWQVTVAYRAGSREVTARWRFDPARRVVTADDDEARWLVGEQPTEPPADRVPSRAPATRRLQAVASPRESGAPVDRTDEVFDADAAEPDGDELTAPVPMLLDVALAPSADDELDDAPVEPGRAEDGGDADRSGHQPGEADEVDAPTAEDPAPEAPAPDDTPVAPAVTRRRGRASVPSWDDILLGTRRKD